MSDGTYTPDDTRRIQLERFIGSVCVGSTGRRGVVTHVDVVYGEWTACGFGLDGKGVWTSKDPHELGTGKQMFEKFRTRFNGCLDHGDVSVDLRDVKQVVQEVLINGPQDTFSMALGDQPRYIKNSLEETRDNVLSQIEAGQDDFTSDYVTIRVDRTAANLSPADFHQRYVEPTRQTFEAADDASHAATSQ